VSLIPFLDTLREDAGSKVGLEGLIGIDLPRIYEECVVTHVLANRGEVDARSDAQTLEFARISNSGEQKKLWGAEHPSAHNDLFTSGHFPSFTWRTVSERMRVIVGL